MHNNWLDALTDGRMFRNWLSLIASFFFSYIYMLFLVAGFAFSVAMIPVLIGIPLLLFMLASTRALADADRQFMAMLLQLDPQTVFDDVDPHGANLGERLGLYLGSPLTWRSLLYLLAKIPVGTVGFIMALMALPLVFIEVLILAPLTIDMRLISVRLLRWSALLLFRANMLLLPSGKSKRAIRAARRLAMEPDSDTHYALGDDGEIAAYQVGRQNI
jgi:hypothetical protein